MTIFPHLQSIPVGIFVPNCCTIALHACCSSTKIGTWANSTFHCWKFDQLSTPITFIFTLSQKEKCKKMLHIFKKQWWKSSHLQSFGFQTHTHTHTHDLEAIETHKNTKGNLHMCNYLFLSKKLAYMMMQWPNYGVSKLLKIHSFLFFVSKSLNPKSFSCSFNK